MSDKTGPYGKELTAREQAHVARWLARHGAAGKEASPLLAARLAARYRAGLLEGAAGGVVVAFLIGYFVWRMARKMAWNLANARYEAGEGPAAGPDPGMGPETGPYLGLLLVAFALLSVGTLAGLWYRRRADRNIARALPHRVARSTAVDLRALLGGWFVAAAAVIYGGGLAAGAAAVAAGADESAARALGVPPGTDSGPDQAVGAVILAAVVVFGAFAVAVLVDVARRPAVADDEVSLADDEVLRREDGHRALTVVMPTFAFIAALHSRSGDGLLLIYLSYAVASAILLSVALVLANRTPAGTAAAVRP